MTNDLKGILRQIIDFQNYSTFEEDINHFEKLLTDTFSWFPNLSLVRQAVLIALSLLIGWKNVLELSKFLSFLSTEKYLDAALNLATFGHDDLANILKNDAIILK